MRLRVESVDFGVLDCRTRLPFRFGVSTLTFAPTLTARVRVATDAGAGEGFAADLCVPKWFEKDPAKSLADDVQALFESARAAAETALGQPGPETAFELWWRSYRERVHHRPREAPDRLVRGFGVALVERAVLDAVARAAGRPFHAALREDLFGFRPGEVHEELADWCPREALPAEPLERVALRHTVGMLDPLRSSDVTACERPDDLPVALEEDIAAHGLTWFKLKLCGELEADLERWLAFGEVLRDRVPRGAARYTLDGNEQFADLGQLVELLDRVDAAPGGRDLLRGLAYIEQPLPRRTSFDPLQRSALAAVAERAPVILDEADHGVEAFPRGLGLGYGGVSVKNCKGVFRGLLNLGLAWRRGAFLSAEDLTTLGVLAVQQDLATIATLGLEHVERNGHHYFHGLDHLPRAEQDAALAAHPDLWERRGELASGPVTLRVTGGTLDLTSVHAAPGFGHAAAIAFAERTPLADYRLPL